MYLPYILWFYMDLCDYVVSIKNLLVIHKIASWPGCDSAGGPVMTHLFFALRSYRTAEFLHFCCCLKKTNCQLDQLQRMQASSSFEVRQHAGKLFHLQTLRKWRGRRLGIFRWRWWIKIVVIYGHWRTFSFVFFIIFAIESLQNK